MIQDMVLSIVGFANLHKDNSICEAMHTPIEWSNLCKFHQKNIYYFLLFKIRAFSIQHTVGQASVQKRKSTADSYAVGCVVGRAMV